MSRLRAIPLFQLSPSRERKEIGRPRGSERRAPIAPSFRAAPIYFSRRCFFFFFFFHSRNGLSWERGTARRLDNEGISNINDMTKDREI